MSDGNDKRNRNAASLAIIAVIILCILALFVTSCHLLSLLLPLE